LITGARGFLGSAIAARLADAGYRIRALSRDPAAGIETVVGNFFDRETAAMAAEGCEAIVHTAGTIDDAARLVNVEGTRAIVGAARSAGARLIHISTLGVYARDRSEVIDEEAPLKVEGDEYGVTKAEADRIVTDAVSRGLDATILRPGGVLGIHPTSWWGVRMPERIRNGQLKLRIDGLDTLPLVHVEDFASAVLMTVEGHLALHRVYNIVDAHTTWVAYADRVRSWFGAPALEMIPAEEVGSGTYFRGRFDASRIRAESGHSPRHSLEDGLSEIERYWKSRLRERRIEAC
jgi:nucleoside-diphosphate-sugar epimerase